MLSKDMEVPGVYFNSTKGNDVKLYMNADDDGSAPIIKYGGANDDDKIWQPPRLWRDIYDKICDARHFIYVAGKSALVLFCCMNSFVQYEASTRSLLHLTLLCLI